MYKYNSLLCYIIYFLSTEYLFSKSPNYTYYRKTVKFILTRGKKRKHDTIPEIIVKNVKGNLLSNARKPGHHV